MTIRFCAIADRQLVAAKLLTLIGRRTTPCNLAPRQANFCVTPPDFLGKLKVEMDMLL
jgi:hypothetical protein